MPSSLGRTPTGAMRLCSLYRQGGVNSMSCQRVIQPSMPVLFGVEGRAFGVGHVPADVDDPGRVVDLSGDRGAGDLRGPDVAAVQVRLVREVHQVVDQQAGPGRERLHPADRRPPLHRQPGRTRDPGRVGQGGVTDENPHEAVLLHDRIAPEPRCAGHPGLPGDGDAAAVRAVGEAVVPADDRVTDQVAGLLGEREPAVHAAVAHRGDLAGLGPPEQDRLPADGAAEQLAAHLSAVGGHVPLVPDDYVLPPTGVPSSTGPR